MQNAAFTLSMAVRVEASLTVIVCENTFLSPLIPIPVYYSHLSADYSNCVLLFFKITYEKGKH